MPTLQSRVGLLLKPRLLRTVAKYPTKSDLNTSHPFSLSFVVLTYLLDRYKRDRDCSHDLRPHPLAHTHCCSDFSSFNETPPPNIILDQPNATLMSIPMPNIDNANGMLIIETAIILLRPMSICTQ